MFECFGEMFHNSGMYSFFLVLKDLHSSTDIRPTSVCVRNLVYCICPLICWELDILAKGNVFVTCVKVGWSLRF